jgi:argininosuccinate lyase
MAYNRDLQEDKPAIFDAFDTVSRALEVAAPLVAKARLKRESIAARLEDGFLDATALMEFLIAHGVPMRTAHEAVGALVKECEARDCRLADLSRERYEKVLPGKGAAICGVLGVPNALKAFRSYGSSAPGEVAKQLAEWQERLAPPLSKSPPASTPTNNRVRSKSHAKRR